MKQVVLLYFAVLARLVLFLVMAAAHSTDFHPPGVTAPDKSIAGEISKLKKEGKKGSELMSGLVKKYNGRWGLVKPDFTKKVYKHPLNQYDTRGAFF